MRPAQRKSTNPKGIAAVECAVALPVLVLLVAATVDICNLIFLRQHMTIAAHEGVRVAITTGSEIEDVEAQVNVILGERGIVPRNISVNPTDFVSADFRTPIEVEVSAEAAANTMFRGVFAKDKVITTRMTMMKEY